MAETHLKATEAAAMIAMNLLLMIASSSWTTVASGFESPSPQPQVQPQPRQDPFTASTFLSPILLNLGFQELAVAVHSLPTTRAWTGPSTIFAPSDASIHGCAACSVSRLLQEHIVPGLFSLHYLRSLPFGTKIETMVPGRCVTVTSADNASKVFVGGIELTQPDLFNNGFIVVHGLDGFASHLSPYSCNVERMTFLHNQPAASTGTPTDQSATATASHPPAPSFSIMRLMLHDAMLRLRISGYTVLALALRVKYAELVGLRNMTIFALDDAAIFNGGHVYVREVRFHIVPNRLLMAGDLERLPPSTVLPTLVPGEELVVSAGRINYVRIKHPDMVFNQRIAVHGLFMPLPHLNPASEIYGSENGPSTGLQAAGGNLNPPPPPPPSPSPLPQTCGISEMDTGCAAAASAAVAPVQDTKLTVQSQIEDQHGL